MRLFSTLHKLTGMFYVMASSLGLSRKNPTKFTFLNDFVGVADRTMETSGLIRTFTVAAGTCSGTSYTQPAPDHTSSVLVSNSAGNSVSISVSVTINSVLISTQTIAPGASYLFLGSNYATATLGRKAYSATWTSI